MAPQSFQSILLDLLCQAQRRENAFVQELDPAELTMPGTSDLWTANDHIAHLTFWRRRLVLRLAPLVQHQEVQLDPTSYEQLNPIVFLEQRDRPWSEIHAESEHVYAELLRLTEQLSEEDLTTPNRFDWYAKDDPLYTAFLGNCYEHAQDHIAQYALERNDLARATHVRETWTRSVTQADVPADLKGFVLYNLDLLLRTAQSLRRGSDDLAGVSDTGTAPERVVAERS
ncbi:MAG: ClbS/DfsB family four-helix bundle protein [Ktedonobacteraceae bacterium]|nr:ClbS/DfsB family four-helix bundle protein [Ktedonobacteraceae bacterium]